MKHETIAYIHPETEFGVKKEKDCVTMFIGPAFDGLTLFFKEASWEKFMDIISKEDK